MGATSIAQYFIGELLHPPRASFIGGFRGITRSANVPGSWRKIMSNLDKEKREALKKFRGQENNDDYDPDRMFTHHHDGTYGVHNHFGVVSFYIMTYEERKELLVKRIADLQRMVDEDSLHDIPDEFQELLIQGGTVNDQYDAKVVDEFFIFSHHTSISKHSVTEFLHITLRVILKEFLHFSVYKSMFIFCFEFVYPY